MLYLMHAVRKWRMWLTGHRVKVLTGHQTLVYMENIRLWNSRLYRWHLELQDLGVTVLYISGVII